MKKNNRFNVQLAFGEKVRALRKERNISQEALANLAELDRSYIGGVERGERNISIANIMNIAVALDVNIRDLFDYD